MAAESVFAANFDGLFDTSNDFGDVGLLQTPTARQRPDGQFGAGVSSQYPYNQAHVFLQLTPWLETTLRYTSVNNLQYDFGDPKAVAFSSQHYKDRSLDFKLKLLDEGQYHPAISLGVQDLGGTGLFSSEYLVSSYHVYDFDFSLGLGWGRLGAGGGLGNPLNVISDRYDTDRSTSSEAGGTGLGRLFTGKNISPFGGVLWRTPVRDVFLKLEYDGNNYEHEAYGNRIDQSIPINVGLEYRPAKGVEFGAGYERGNQFTASIELGLNFQQFRGLAKPSDPAKPPARAVPLAQNSPVSSQAAVVQPAGHPPAAEGIDHAAPTSVASGNTASKSVKPPAAAGTQASTSAPASAIDYRGEVSRFAIAVKTELNRQHIGFEALTLEPQATNVIVWVNAGPYRNPSELVDRTARTLSAAAPARVTTFTIVDTNDGVELSRTIVPREELEKVAAFQVEPIDLIKDVMLNAPHSSGEMQRAMVVDGTRYPGFDWTMGPSLRQSVGGPDNFYYVQLWWRTDAELTLGDGLSLSGAAGLNVYNNFDTLTLPSNSKLPHVRSDIAQYLKEGENNIVRLETDFIRSPLSDVYTRLSAGIFEEMYGGAAGEVLWRPYGRRWAIGVDVNYLKQRDYNQAFDFRNYKIATGFIDFYYQLPIYNVLARLSAGRYLAGDKGATVDLSRQFANGVRAGIFATKTNVSAAQFGEGSFDKGVYIVLPLDLFFTSSSQAYASALFRPTTRDGGQRALDGKSLYSVTDGHSPSAFASGWDEAQH